MDTFAKQSRMFSFSMVVALCFTTSLTSAAFSETPKQTKAVATSPLVSPEVEGWRKEGVALVYKLAASKAEIADAVALLEKAEAAGDQQSTLILGGLYLYGTVLPANPKRALQYFETAASAGNGAGLANYGTALMWKNTNWKVAEKTLVRAAEMGESKAWATLAEGAMYGYLGGGTYSRAKFDGYAAKARAAGNMRIEVLDAARQMWGISMRADGPATVAKLRKAADAGNPLAASYLISLLRDGNQMNIARNRRDATDSLKAYAAILPEGEAWSLGLSLRASKAHSLEAKADIAAEMSAHPDLVTVALAQQLHKANPNVAIYLLQSRMKEYGTYSGRLDGLAGDNTLKAIYAACKARLNLDHCADIVLKPDVIAQLIGKSWEVVEAKDALQTVSQPSAP